MDAFLAAPRVLWVLDVSGQVAAADLDEHVRPALAPGGGVIRQPPAKDERYPGLHGRQRFRDRRGLAQVGVNQLRGVGLDSDQFGEHLGFELPAGVKEGLQFFRGLPLRIRNQGREVVVGAHRTLLADEIRFVEVIGPDYEGFGPGGLLADFKQGFSTLKHIRDFKRTAVVSDKEWVARTMHALGWMIPGEVAVFGMDEYQDAKRWAAA